MSPASSRRPIPWTRHLRFAVSSSVSRSPPRSGRSASSSSGEPSPKAASYGFVSGLGVATADATYGAIAAFGLAAVTDVLVNARQVLGLVGGAFLLWLAWQTIQSRPTEAATVASRRRGYAGAYLSILGLTLANPMTILSFGALFAGFGVTHGVTGDAVLIVLGVLLGSPPGGSF